MDSDGAVQVPILAGAASPQLWEFWLESVHNWPSHDRFSFTEESALLETHGGFHQPMTNTEAQKTDTASSRDNSGEIYPVELSLWNWAEASIQLNPYLSWAVSLSPFHSPHCFLYIFFSWESSFIQENTNSDFTSRKSNLRQYPYNDRKQFLFSFFFFFFFFF